MPRIHLPGSTREIRDACEICDACGVRENPAAPFDADESKMAMLTKTGKMESVYNQIPYFNSLHFLFRSLIRMTNSFASFFTASAFSSVMASVNSENATVIWLSTFARALLLIGSE